MHSHASIARDETTREIYTRAHIPYWNLRRQAEQVDAPDRRARLAKRCPLRLVNADCEKERTRSLV